MSTSCILTCLIAHSELEFDILAFYILSMHVHRNIVPYRYFQFSTTSSNGRLAKVSGLQHPCRSW
jgi:hypothetical protein